MHASIKKKWSTIGMIMLCHETFEHSLFDSKIMHFYSFFIRVIFPYKGKMVPCMYGLARAMKRTMNFFQ
jgi:hypothetical protein